MLKKGDCNYVGMSAHAYNSKSIHRIELLLSQTVESTSGPVILTDNLDSDCETRAITYKQSYVKYLHNNIRHGRKWESW